MLISITLKIGAYIRAYSEYRRAKRELYNLSDRELSDIGISRCDIETIAKQASKDTLATA